MSLHYKLSVVQGPAVTANLPGAKVLHPTGNRLEPKQSTASRPDMAKWFGEDIRSILDNIKAVDFAEAEEIRVRIGQPLMIRTAIEDLFLSRQGKAVNSDEAYRVTREDVYCALERMTHSSVYAAEEDLKQGFLTLPGGNRVGVTGEVVLQNGQIQTMKHISALNLRIARDIEGGGLKILPLILGPNKSVNHTLLISPPRAGKTTLLRDLIRLISNGVPELGLNGQTVGVVDERGELAGMWQGTPTYDLGFRTDILDGCPKAKGMSMLIRAMAPQVIAMDELGQPEDGAALSDALRTGVQILSTAHAGSLEEALSRPALAQLLDQGVFERLVVLSRKNGPGTLEKVYDLKTGRTL